MSLMTRGRSRALRVSESDLVNPTTGQVLGDDEVGSPTLGGHRTGIAASSAVTAQQQSLRISDGSLTAIKGHLRQPSPTK